MIETFNFCYHMLPYVTICYHADGYHVEQAHAPARVGSGKKEPSFCNSTFSSVREGKGREEKSWNVVYINKELLVFGHAERVFAILA